MNNINKNQMSRDFIFQKLNNPELINNKHIIKKN